MSAQVAILAGGQSRRMGTDKSFVLLDGKPLIEHVLERLSPLNLPVLIISNRPVAYAHLGYPVHRDVLPNQGSLGGLYSAIHYSRTQYTLCVACDMPFLHTGLLQYLIEQASGWDAVVPLVNGTSQGLHAVYARHCLDTIKKQIQTKQLAIHDLLIHLQTNLVKETECRLFDPDLHSFDNLNTQDELLQAESRVRTALGGFQVSEFTDEGQEVNLKSPRAAHESEMQRRDSIA